ncbi:hypothetical protein PG2006B_1121 [Bifidobacterium animalis subsp. animalis]|nr:hypothetical protein PG2006B_1121 [Bifidobacterium animalis subsp. animalis]
MNTTNGNPMSVEEFENGSNVSLLTLRLAEGLLDYCASSAAHGAFPLDVYADGQPHTGDDVAGRAHAVPSGVVFDKLLADEIAVEEEFSEAGYMLLMPLRKGLVLSADGDGHVECVCTAIIEDAYGSGFGIEFGVPFVDRLIGGNAQRPLADRIRVLTYLVRLGCQVVRLDGDTIRIDGDPVGFLSRTVRLLGQLVRFGRLQQGDHTGDTAQSTNPADEQIRNTPSIHDTNATNTNTATCAEALASKEGGQ